MTRWIDTAVRVLEKYFESDIILMHDEAHGGVYLCATVHTKESAANSRENGRTEVRAGTVEYMVCDGPPGARSESRDFFSADEAKVEFAAIVKHGWELPAVKPKER